ncbi:MAG: phosphatidate cytidylyltransferase [Smithellaceae bacterium]|nr:phosphatidate cytidylyltransferase [Smithellaceae bacterium]
MNPHIKRWATAAVAIPLLFVLIYFGPLEAVAALVAVVVIIGTMEYNQMVFGDGHRLEKGAVLLMAFFILLAAYLGDFKGMLSAVVFIVPLMAVVFLFGVHEEHFDVTMVMKAALGVLYIPLLVSYFILLRRVDDGVLWIFFVIVLTFAGDASAFYAGRTWGKRKLLPAVSPAKTQEGVVGLIIGSILASVIYISLLLKSVPLAHAVIIGFLGSIMGQLGDLWESAIKRYCGVKDSGNILPGHGGIMDRLDSLAFIAPFVFYYRLFLLG